MFLDPARSPRELRHLSRYQIALALCVVALTATGILLTPRVASSGVDPQPFHGLLVQPLGQAVLGEQLPPPFLDVNNIGSSGQDGVRVDVGATRSSIGPIRWMAPESLAGRRYSVISHGSDAAGDLWWGMEAVDLGGPVAFSIDPGNLVVAGSLVHLTLTQGDTPIYELDLANTTSPLFTSSAPPTGVADGLGEIAALFDQFPSKAIPIVILDDRNWEFESGTQISIGGMGTFTADGVHISHRLRHRDRLVLHHMDVLFAEPDGLVGTQTLRDVAAGCFGTTLRGRGGATMEVWSDWVNEHVYMGNTGASSEDGVSSDLASHEFGHSFDLDPSMLPLPLAGESMALRLEDQSETTAVQARCSRATSYFDIGFEPTLPTTPVAVAFYADGELVATAVDPTAPVIVEASTWPLAVGMEVDDATQPPACRFEWGSFVAMHSGSEAPVSADEVRLVLAPAATKMKWVDRVTLSVDWASPDGFTLLGLPNAVHPPDPGLPWVSARASDHAHVVAHDRHLWISNIGSSGEDGVSVEFVGGRQLSLSWITQWSGAGKAGQGLEIGVEGTAEGNPDKPIIVGRVYNESDGSQILLGADLSGVGATMLSYVLYDDEVPVGSIEAVNDIPALSLPSLPTGLTAELGPTMDPSVPSLRIQLVPDTPVTELGGPTKRMTKADIIEVLIGDTRTTRLTDLVALTTTGKDLGWVVTGDYGREGPVTDAPPARTAEGLRLYPSVPNPFNPRTEIVFELDRGGPASLHIHDARGRLVAVLQDGFLGAGPHRRIWDGTDLRGRSVASGVYYLRLEALGTSRSQKLSLVR